MFKFFNRSAPKNVIPYSQPSMFSSGAGYPISHELAMKVAAFNRGVVYISTQVAKLPIKITDANGSERRDRIYHLINVAPNSEMNAFKFWTSIISNALRKGNGYAEIERDMAGRPIGLHIIDNEVITPTRDENGKFVFEINGPVGKRYLDPMNVLHIPNLWMINGIGQDIVRWAAGAIGISVGADDMAAAIFQNGGFPQGVISLDGRVSEEAANRMRRQWKQMYGSKGKEKGGVAVLDQKARYEPIPVNPQLLQFLESRQFGVVEIARFLGVTPHKLYDQTKSTYDNVEQANLEVVTDTIDTWAVNIECEIDVKLLTGQHSGRKADTDFFSLVRGDMKTRSEYYKARFIVGSINPNEIRVKEGDAPYEGGDKYYIQSNNYAPVDRIDDLIDADIEAKKAKVESAKGEKESSEKEEEVVNALLNKINRG